METIATLIEKMIVTHLKIWHHEEEAIREDMSADYIVEIRKTIQQLNAERYELMTELDELIKEQIEGRKSVKISRAHKLYRSSR